MEHTLEAVELRCESRRDPIGIDTERPRFSWVLDAGGRRAAGQSAWQLQVHDRADDRLLWDSGRVADAHQHHIRYAGAALASFQDCGWRVRVWSAQDAAPSEWSKLARFVTGFMGGESFSCDWIRYPVDRLPDACRLRRTFTLERPVAAAFLAITARGIFEPHLDGQRIGQDYFQPGWTDYVQRIHYRVYDCTALLTGARPRARHRLGALLGEGWWRGQVSNDAGGGYGHQCMLRAELHVRHDDGSTTTIGTDDQWECRSSEFQLASLQHGERVDARRADADWCAVDSGSGGWTRPVVSRHDQPVNYRAQRRGWVHEPATMSAHPGPPIRVVDTLVAVSVHEAEPGSWIYDIGQNIAGIPSLRLQASAGTVVRLRYGEMVNPDGTLYVENLRSAQVTDTYICRGGGTGSSSDGGPGGGERHESRLTFHGFRYIEVTGLAKAPPLEAVSAKVLTSELEETGTFSCSNPMLEQLHRNIRWTMRGNFIDIPTDCPQRDERLGWTGDAQVFLPAASGLADVEAFFRKWQLDLADEQREDGSVPDYVPSYGSDSEADAAWGDAMCVIPTELYLRYGDPEMLSEWLPRMVAFCDHLARRVDADGLRRGGNAFHGDWLALDHPAPDDPAGAPASPGSIGHTPAPLIQTAFLAYSCRLAARAAAQVGDATVVRTMQSRVDAATDALQGSYFAADGRLRTGVPETQTGYVLALAFDVLPAEARAAALERLVALIEGNDGLLNTGFVGTSYLLQTLDRFGRTDLAYSLLEEERFPSWGYSIANGATTIWERWNGWLAGVGPSDPNMNSYNHYAFGSVAAFLHERVCGLRPLEPGYRVAEVAPKPGGTLTHASYRYNSIVGPWLSAWRVSGPGYAYHITVPPGATARCRLPLGAASGLVEDGVRLEEVTGVSNPRRPSDAIAFELASGEYRFQPAQG